VTQKVVFRQDDSGSDNDDVTTAMQKKENKKPSKSSQPANPILARLAQTLGKK